MKKNKIQKDINDNSLTDLDLDIWGESKTQEMPDYVNNNATADVPEGGTPQAEANTETRNVKEVHHHISFQEPTKLTPLQRIKRIAGGTLVTITLTILVTIALNMLLNPSMTLFQFVDSVVQNIKSLVNG